VWRARASVIKRHVTQCLGRARPRFAQGELERFSRRELANVIAFSNSDEFKSTIVMLKLLQGSIVSEVLTACLPFSLSVQSLSCVMAGGLPPLMMSCSLGRALRAVAALPLPALLSHLLAAPSVFDALSLLLFASRPPSLPPSLLPPSLPPPFSLPPSRFLRVPLSLWRRCGGGARTHQVRRAAAGTEVLVKGALTGGGHGQGEREQEQGKTEGAGCRLASEGSGAGSDAHGQGGDAHGQGGRLMPLDVSGLPPAT